MKRYSGIFYVIFLCFLLMAGGCKHESLAAKSMKKIDERKAEKAKEAQAAYDQAMKKHMDIQDPATKKRMKKDKKAAKKWMKQRNLNPALCPAATGK